MAERLSLIIPVLNEEAKIERDVRSAFSFFNSQDWLLELIVSDDGSTDGTQQIVRQLQREFGQDLKLLDSQQHYGKGHAVRQGLLASSGKIVAFMDSGGTAPLSYLLTGLDLIKKQECEIAAGSRFLPNSRITLPMPFKRRLFSFLFRKWVHFYMKLPETIRDPQCGFKVFAGPVARQLAEQATIDGFLFDLEFYFLARRNNWRWREFPIEWRCDLDSRLSVGREVFSVLRDLKRLRRRFISRGE